MVAEAGKVFHWMRGSARREETDVGMLSGGAYSCVGLTA